MACDGEQNLGERGVIEVKRRKFQGEPHGRSLVGCGPRGH